MTFVEKLEAAVVKNNTLLCIGLDPDAHKIPVAMQSGEAPLFDFNKFVVNATFDEVCCYKPNSAFYEAEGADGIRQLKDTCDYIKKTYPDIPIILDAKRADIGSSTKAYARYAFEYLGVDAITVNPYLGREAVGPFLDRADRGCVVLCRTSNLGAQEFQDLSVDGRPLYEVVAREVATKWNKNANCMLVVGATYPEELARVRKIAPQMPFLVPGVGAQGGDLSAVLRAGLRPDGMGLVVSVTRSVIYVESDGKLENAVRDEARKLKGQINTYRSG